VDAELVTLAVSAGSVLVGAMLTDTWAAAKNRIIALWLRYQPDEAPAVAHALDQTQGHLARTGDGSCLPDRAAAESQWQERLSVFLAEHPQAAGALAGLIGQLGTQQAAYTVHGDNVINITTLVF
jgi:hypothetical protein